jgi:hypothetical protein
MKKITIFLIVMFAINIGYSQPTTIQPDPTHLVSNVKSVYGDTYSSASITTNYNPYWGQAQAGRVVNEAYPVDATNNVLAYINYNYQGTELTTTNLSGMEYLHIDIWTSSSATITVTPINNGTGVTEFLVPVTTVVSGWSSVDIPKSSFIGMTWDSVYQMKFAGGDGTIAIYLDNIYFWKAPVTAASDASLSDLQVDGATVPGFVSSASQYDVDLVVGTSTIPQITLATPTESTSNAVITQATSIPGDATVLVTSQDGTQITYTISFDDNIPGPSPTPITPNYQVMSVFGDTAGYTYIWPPSYDFGSNAGIPDLDTTSGVNTAIKMNFELAGWGQGNLNSMDITANDYVHFDYFAGSDSSEIRFILISEGNGEQYYELATGGSDGTLVAGSWQSVDVPLSFFVNKGFDKTKFLQFKLATSSDLVSKIVYFDNIYIYNSSATLNTSDFNKTSVSAYPNPTSAVWNINAGEVISSVELFNLQGVLIQTTASSSEQVSINVSNLPSGLYIAKVTTASGTKVIKLVKE